MQKLTLSAFVALMWTAILTVQAGNFLQRCIEVLRPAEMHNGR